jgi:hypothetical protein
MFPKVYPASEDLFSHFLIFHTSFFIRPSRKHQATSFPGILTSFPHYSTSFLSIPINLLSISKKLFQHSTTSIAAIPRNILMLPMLPSRLNILKFVYSPIQTFYFFF